MSIENSSNNQEKEITFDNLIKKGNVINIDGDSCEIILVEHLLPLSSDGGFYRIFAQPKNGTLEKQLQVKAEDAQDWYILYQNGKK